jgi:hypothetical protein
MDLLHIFVGSDPIASSHVLSFHRQRQILGHDTIHIDSLHTSLFEISRKFSEFRSVV